jgi:hypothetical protein
LETDFGLDSRQLIANAEKSRGYILKEGLVYTVHQQPSIGQSLRRSKHPIGWSESGDLSRDLCVTWRCQNTAVIQQKILATDPV